MNCYYAHAEGDEGLQRRCYWILDKDKDDVVMVHYLCTSTSRVSGRTAPASSNDIPSGYTSRSRPTRKAAQQARLQAKLLSEQSEEERHRISVSDSRRTSGFTVASDNFSQRSTVGGSTVIGGQNIGIRIQGGEIPQQQQKHDVNVDALFTIPGFNSQEELVHLRPERNPGLLHVSEEQAVAFRNGSGIGSPAMSPQSKGMLPQLSFGLDLDVIVGNSSYNQEDKAAGKRNNSRALQSEHSHDLLIPGFSRFDSLSEYFPGLEAMDKDGHLPSLGLFRTSIGRSGMDKQSNAQMPAEAQRHAIEQNTIKASSSSQSGASEKVVTLRRVAFNKPDTSITFGQNQQIDSVPPFYKQARRRNPTELPPIKAPEDRIRAAQDAHMQRREDTVQKIRESRDQVVGDDLLIEPQNVLFRMQSHVVDWEQENPLSPIKALMRESPEKAATLFKQMSIDEKGNIEFTPSTGTELARENSSLIFAERGSEHGAGFGSEQEIVSKSNTATSDPSSVHGSRDPSFTSMLDGASMLRRVDQSASTSAAGDDALRQAFELRKVHANKKDLQKQ